jgi:hypothetical protein
VYTARAEVTRAAGGSALQAVASLPELRGGALSPRPGGFEGLAAAPGEGTEVAGEAGTDGAVLLADQFDGGWRLELTGDETEVAPARSFGWAIGFRVPRDPGEVDLYYTGQARRTIELAVLAGLWAAALWITRKPARRYTSPRRAGR